MNKSILIIMVVTLLVSVSAIYAGEQSEPFDIGQDYDYYSIIGNSSEVKISMSDSIINSSGTWITITPDKYSVDDTYEVVFFNKEKEIIVYRGGGGGSSHTIYKDRNVTKYVDKIVEVPGTTKDNIIEKIIEVSSKRRGTNILFACLILVILSLILWNFTQADKRKKDFYTREKEVQNGI